MQLSDYVKLIRKAKGLTLSDLSQRSGLSRGYIHLIESGEQVNPTINALLSLSKGLDIPIGQIINSVYQTEDSSEENVPLPFDM